MATYEITDSTLKRHYEQHLAAGGAPVADRFERIVDAATGAAQSAVDEVASQAAAAVDAVPASSSIWKKLLPVIALAILAWFGFKYFTNNGPDIAAMSKDLTGVFSSITSSFGKITDAVSAKAALPSLTEIGTKLDGVSELFSKAPDAAKSTLSKLVADNFDTIQALVDKLLALPGVGDVIKPVVDPIMAKLKAMVG